jgi:hypothetical protein
MVVEIGRGRSLGFPYCALWQHVGGAGDFPRYKIRNDPAALALLDAVDFEANELGAARTRSEAPGWRGRVCP